MERCRDNETGGAVTAPLISYSESGKDCKELAGGGGKALACHPSLD